MAHTAIQKVLEGVPVGYQRVQRNKQRNLSAKYAHLFNKGGAQVDRKKAEKAGKRKHKTKRYNDDI